LPIDVFVLTKNCEKTLGLTLKSIANNIPIARLIVVDEGSSDETLEIARSFADFIVDDGGRGIGHARNLALSLAETEIFAFIDSDVIITDGWLNSLIRHFIDRKVICAEGFWIPFCPISLAIYNYYFSKLGNSFATFSNTLCRTRTLKEVGIPKIIEDEDRKARKRAEASGYRWVVDRKAKVHSFKSLWNWILSARRSGRAGDIYSWSTPKQMIFELATTPAVSLPLLVKDPRLVICYSALRFARSVGYFETYHARTCQTED
jgi:glycosyltransferase involved in cell wall biosynthesis